MRRFPGPLQSVLAGAIEAGRAALRDLDRDDVPAGLKRVAAHTGGRLPPPLGASLLEALDDEEWFRDKAAEKLAEPIEADDPARLFLQRPAGWWTELAAAVAVTAVADEEQRADRAQQQVELLRSKVEESKRKLNDARRRERTSVGELKAQLGATRKQLKAAVAASGGDTSTLEQSLAEVQRRLREAEAARAEVQEMLAEQRVRLRRLRRERAEAERKARRGGATSFGGDAIDMARTLDQMAAGVRVAGRRAEEPPNVESAEPSPALGLPAGLAPDSPDAVTWLVGSGSAFSLVVDGYNVLFHLDRGDFSTGLARQRLAQELGRLKREAGTARVIVVYDSALPGGRRARPTPGGIDVRFAEEDRLADEEVILLAAELEGAVVVVSSDREVREGAEAVGALALWSEALVGWIAAG
jgi:predicted RNA-binding protein with PIN domain